MGITSVHPQVQSDVTTNRPPDAFAVRPVQCLVFPDSESAIHIHEVRDSLTTDRQKSSSIVRPVGEIVHLISLRNAS